MAMLCCHVCYTRHVVLFEGMLGRQRKELSHTGRTGWGRQSLSGSLTAWDLPVTAIFHATGTRQCQEAAEMHTMLQHGAQQACHHSKRRREREGGEKGWGQVGREEGMMVQHGYRQVYMAGKARFGGVAVQVGIAGNARSETRTNHLTHPEGRGKNPIHHQRMQHGRQHAVQATTPPHSHSTHCHPTPLPHAKCRVL